MFKFTENGTKNSCRKHSAIEMIHEIALYKLTTDIFDIGAREQFLAVAAEVILKACNPLGLSAHCCHIGTAIKHPVPPDRVKPSFVIFDIRAL